MGVPCIRGHLFFSFASSSGATTRLCGELWLAEGCPHMDPPSPLHQLHLATWVSCGTKLILLLLLLCGQNIIGWDY